MTFVDSDIFHRMVLLRKLHSVTLIYLLNVNNVKIVYLWNGKNERKDGLDTFVDFDIFHRTVQLRKLHSVNLTYCLKVKIKNVNISETLRASAKKNARNDF